MENATFFNATLKKLNLVFLAFLGALLLFAAVAFYFSFSKGFSLELSKQDEYLFYLIPLIFALIHLPLAFWMHKHLLKKIQPKFSAERKIQFYFTISLLRLALIEAAGTFTLIFYLLTANRNLLLIFVMSLLFVLIARPSRAKMLEEIPFSDEERNEIENQ